MTKSKKKSKPLSLSLLPGRKKTPKHKKLQLLTTQQNRKKVGYRLRLETIDMIDELARKLTKVTNFKYSKGAVIELSVKMASKTDIKDLIKYYSETYDIG